MYVDRFGVYLYRYTIHIFVRVCNVICTCDIKCFYALLLTACTWSVCRMCVRVSFWMEWECVFIAWVVFIWWFFDVQWLSKKHVFSMNSIWCTKHILITRTHYVKSGNYLNLASLKLQRRERRTFGTVHKKRLNYNNKISCALECECNFYLSANKLW